MNVDLHEMRAGADRSHSAAELAADAVERLAGSQVAVGIFGDFTAAETFQALAHASHSNHVQRLHAHQNTLAALGDRTRRTATAFDEMEDRNAAALRSVLWPITPA